jgi:hypothetical protein
MLGAVSKKFVEIMDDSSLYGHCLTTLPEKATDFATSLDNREYLPVTANSPLSHWVFRPYRDVTNDESGGRRICSAHDFLWMQAVATKGIGFVLFWASLATAAPLGFAIKTIHYVGLQLTSRQLMCA